MLRPLLFLLCLFAGAAAPPPEAELERYKAKLDAEIGSKPWEPEAYLARSGYFMHKKDWPRAAEDWLEGRRLWISKNHGGLGIRAPDHAVLLIASVMSAADRAGLDPDLSAERFMATFTETEEE